MVKYLVQKKGFRQSAAIYSTKKAAESAGVLFYPDVPFKIVKISDSDARKRKAMFEKRFKNSRKREKRR